MYRVEVTSPVGKGWIGRLLESGKTCWMQVSTGKVCPTPGEALEYCLNMAHARGADRDAVEVVCPTGEVFSAENNYREWPKITIPAHTTNIELTWTDGVHVHVGSTGYNWEYRKQLFYFNMHFYFEGGVWSFKESESESECSVNKEGSHGMPGSRATSLQTKAVIAAVLEAVKQYCAEHPEVWVRAAERDAWDKASKAEAVLIEAEAKLSSARAEYVTRTAQYAAVVGCLPKGITVKLD